MSAGASHKTRGVIWLGDCFTIFVMRSNATKSGHVSRREVLKHLAAAGLCLPLGGLATNAFGRGFNPLLLPQTSPSPAQSSSASATPASPVTAYILTPSDDAFLEELERANFL